MSPTSTKPYLLRAIYEWCTDNGYTPYIAVKVNAQARVPMQFVKNGEIVLNIGFGATSGLKMDNDLIHFSARFGGVAREISVPVDNVLAIYASENGQGMAFDVPKQSAAADDAEPTEATPAATTLTSVPSVQTEVADVAETPTDDNTGQPKKGGRPTLTRIK